MTSPPAIRIERDVPVPMADGTVLRAEVWRPDDGRRHPAVLIRTPYLKESATPLPITDARMATARGYALVAQDVRGRGTSEGTFEPFVHEERDGADTVAWLAAQPWCDGRVVMAGMSYVGATQWLAAAASPPALEAIAPTLSSDGFGEGWSLRSGVPEHGFLATWNAADLAPPEQRWEDRPERAYDDPEGLARIAPWSGSWWTEPGDSAYWRARSVAARRDRIDVPALLVGGWYDIFLAGTLDAFARSRHPSDRLLIGPWGHDSKLSHLVGELNAGIAGSGEPAMFAAALDFYDAVLAGREPDAPRVRAYVLGARRWDDHTAWPPPGARATRMALEPGTFSVRPEDPVPSLGGRGLLVGVAGIDFGARDQRPLAGRPDVHVALRAAGAEATTLAGPVRAHLAVEPEGDRAALWTVTLCLEQPEGAWLNLCEGVGRSAPGAERLTVELGDVCVEVAAGQALVVLVAGSSFPRWPRPPAARTQAILEGSALELTRMGE